MNTGENEQAGSMMMFLCKSIIVEYTIHIMKQMMKYMVVVVVVVAADEQVVFNGANCS